MNVTVVFSSANESHIILNSSSDYSVQEGLVDSDRILRLIQLYIRPMIGTIGMIVNILTLVVLTKMGVRKPSTILIISLTVADCLYFINSINVIQLLARFGHDTIRFTYYGWDFQENVASFVFIVDRLLDVLHYLGAFVSTGVPVLITLERFLATFFPLTFKLLVTPKRVLILNIAVWLFWMPWALLVIFWFSLRSTVLPNGQLIFYRINTLSHYIDVDTYDILNTYFCNILSSIVPICLVCIGCLLIGIKVKLVQRQRRLMVSSNKTSSLRTTLTLVSVSLVFAVTNVIYFILSLVYENTPQSNFLKIIYQCLRILLDISSASNFFVYVILNAKFRHIFVDTFVIKWVLFFRETI
ncbi:hypothetical protein BgiMline_026135 [Biomphalaria glabrata]|nr:putative G-protein coupled receptor F59B2.13 [Biomphalaria glabrata]KAI8778647.1 G-protein coupled receptor F59B2.13 [Biomphalaria glabrata]